VQTVFHILQDRRARRSFQSCVYRQIASRAKEDERPRLKAVTAEGRNCTGTFLRVADLWLKPPPH
jgi:hypothetical protein